VGASRIGERVSFEVQDLAPIEFLDPFAYHRAAPAVFAVYWPPGVGVERLRALRRILPESPSPLERGDSLFVLGRFSEARTAYQEQARAFRDAQVAQQARYKEAMCLAALERGSEAERILERVAGESGDRWPALAACWLWLRCVREKRFAEADAIFQSVASRYRLDQLAPFIPSELREDIVFGYRRQSVKFGLYRFNPDIVRRCQQGLAIAEFLESNASTQGWARWSVVRAHMANGQEDQALQIAADGIQRDRPAEFDGSRGSRYADYFWLLRLAGHTQQALAELDHWIGKEPGQPPRRWHAEVILERARILTALDRWDEAQQTLDDLFGAVTPQQMGGTYTPACAMLGFLRQRRGDIDGARQVWAEGLSSDWMTGQGFQFLYGLILASLVGQISETEAQAVVGHVVGSEADHSLLALAGTPIGRQLLRPGVVASVLRDAFRSPRGEDYAWKIVFREIPFAECVRVPPMLIAYQWLRQGALPEKIADEQEAVVWKLVGDGYTAIVETGALDESQLLQLGLTWKGVTSFVGWAGVGPTLDPKLRGPLAYVLGYRYLRLGRPADAAMFFRTALEDAPQHASLGRLAQVELDRLSAGKPEGR
jgi:tetratricopeptide (TPR) repeat protein